MIKSDFPHIIALLMLLILSACAKKEEHSFRGKIVSSCEVDDPLANEKVTIYFLKKSSGLGPGGRSFEYPTTTDSEGNFELKFEEKNWDLNGGGTYGAELIVKGRVILSGITPATRDLGNVVYDFNRQVDVIATINTSGLDQTDTILINQEVIGTGNFTNFQDTVTAYLTNKAGEANPVILENQTAILRWQIKNDKIITNGKESILLNDDCITEVAHNFTITK